MRAVLVALLVALAPRAGAEPVDDAMANVQALRRFDGELGSLSRWADVAGGDASVRACLASLDTAVAAGARWDREIEVRNDLRDRLPLSRQAGEKGFSTLRLVREHCRARLARVQLVRAYIVVTSAARELQRVRQGMSPQRLADKLPNLALQQRVCSREVKRALEARNSPAIAFDRAGVTLGEAEAKVCVPLLAEVIRAREGDGKSHMVPGLEGARRSIYAGESLHAEEVYGPSRTPLVSPEDWRYATAWYVVFPDQDDAGEPAWQVRIHRFDGDRLVDTTEQRGAGRSPPRDLFGPEERP